MYFEIVRKGERLAVGDDLLVTDYTYTIDTIPEFSVTLPIQYVSMLQRRSEIIIHYDDGTLMHGMIQSHSIDKSAETIQAAYAHVFQEWSYQSLPVNVAKKKAKISALMHDKDFIYTNRSWDIEVFDDEEIEYEFSRQTKREALDKIISLTTYLSYRVSRTHDRRLEIGKFGKHTDLLLSSQNMLNGLTIENDASNIMNVVVALADKNDGGSTAVTLRDVYNNKSIQDPKFPVIITGNKINTQSPQVGYSLMEYAPNNIHEYAVVDIEGIEREDGDIYEGTTTANDISPIEEDGKPITNEARLEAAKMLYKKTCRKARFSRRNIKYTTSIGYLDPAINVGDMARLVFENNLDTYGECDGLTTQRMMSIDKWLYIVAIRVSFGTDGVPIYELTLCEDLTEYLSGRDED